MYGKKFNDQLKQDELLGQLNYITHLKNDVTSQLNSHCIFVVIVIDIESSQLKV